MCIDSGLLEALSEGLPYKESWYLEAGVGALLGSMMEGWLRDPRPSALPRSGRRWRTTGFSILGDSDMGDCQNYGPFLGPLSTGCRTILRNQKGTIILTTTHIAEP